MSLAAWHLQNGNKAVRVPLGTCRTCVLCLNNRWCRGQGRRPQNTSYFPAVGNPTGGSVYCETGRIIHDRLQSQSPNSSTRNHKIRRGATPLGLQRVRMDLSYAPRYFGCPLPQVPSVNVPLLINNWQYSISLRPVQGR